MTGYWDIHNHILPGVDDGSGCMRETMEMLEEEYRQGVRHIVFTPHYRRGMFAIPIVNYNDSNCYIFFYVEYDCGAFVWI